MIPSAFRFDTFELKPSQRQLLQRGRPVPLRTRPFDVLLVLVERAGALVTKAELLDKVWPGLVVEENNIAAQVAALRKAVGSDLIATIPGHGYRFTAAVEVVEDSPAPAIARVVPVAAGEPTPTSVSRLFGRDEDLARLEAELRLPGCITLVGPGGVGKTALARAAASRWSGSSVWIDLAALSADDQLPGVLSRRLGIAPPLMPEGGIGAPLARALSGAGRLLVLDNAEHLVDAVAALVRDLQEAIPTVAILVTSQLPLHVTRERVLHLEPLPFPAEEDGDDAALSTGALAMLVDRVRAADRRFPLGADALAKLRRICAQLDGLPLALEMAATRVPVLGVDAVLHGLDERFSMLTRGQRGAATRHKTLRGALEWSHALLTPEEQALFRRLAAFADGFSLDLAVAVGATEAVDRWECIDLLSQLVERSLVTSLHAEPPRYRLLETMRTFALESLLASGEEGVIRTRLANALVELMESAHRSPADRALATHAAAELGNVRGALVWTRAHDPALAIALTLSASTVATWTTWRGEAARWVEACEPLIDSVPKGVQAEWWTELARHQSFNRGARTVEAARRACDLQRALGNDTGLFWGLIPQLRSRALDAQDFEACRIEAQALLDRHPEWPVRLPILLQGSLALEYRRRSDFAAALVHQRAELELAVRHRAELAPESIDNAQVNLAGTLTGLGRHEEALELMDALLARCGEAETTVAAHCRIQQLHALIGLDRLDDAARDASRVLSLCQKLDVPNVLEALGLLAQRQGRVEAAVQWIGRYREYYRERMADLPDDAHAAWHHVIASAGLALDEATIATLMTRGAALDTAGLMRLLTADTSRDDR